MRESLEIAHARAIRNGQKADLSSLARFERDFRGADWFRQHPKIEPVAELYFYDFAEKRLKIHR